GGTDARSAPDEKPRPAPVSSTARTSSSPATRSIASRSARISGSSSALSTSGRFSVMVAIPSMNSYSTGGAVTGSPFVHRFSGQAKLACREVVEDLLGAAADHHDLHLSIDPLHAAAAHVTGASEDLDRFVGAVAHDACSMILDQRDFRN